MSFHTPPADFANAEALPSSAKPTGIDVPLASSPTPPAEKAVTPARTLKEAAKPKAAHYIASADRLDIITASALDGGLTPAARRVLAIIVAHYNHHKGFAFPGEDRIAELLGLARPVVSAAVKLLGARGWLKIERTRNGNRNGGNRYYLVLDKGGPMLDAAGLSVTKSGRSEAVSVTSREPESHVSDRLNVTFSCASASSKHDDNPAREPNKRTQQSEPAHARSRELPASSFSGGDERRPPQVEKVPFPENFRFKPEAEAAARAKGLNDSDIASAGEGYRRLVGAELRTRDHLDRAGAAYLAKRQPKPDPDETVRVTQGTLMSERRCKRSEVKPWESYTDLKGVRHPARVKSPYPVV